LPLLGEQPTCAVLVNDAQPTGVTEVRAFARYTDDPSTPALLRALEGEQGALAAHALAARGNEGPRAVADAFVGYGALGRRRALELSASLPDESGTPIELQALAQGDAAQRARAEEQLLARGAGALPGLLAALGVAAETAPSTNAPSTTAPATNTPSTTVPVTAAPPTPAAELAWLRLLARLQPERVVAVTLPRLDRPSARQRAELRTLIGELAGQAVHQPELRSAFADTQRPRRVRVELLRALGTSQGEESSRFEPELSTAFLQLAEKPSFAEQYVLVDVALRLRERPEARERLRLLWRELPGDWSAAQRDAYLTRLLEGWSEALLPSDAAFGPWVDTVAKSGGVRVRKMAAAWLGRSVVAAPSLAGLARQDAWPLVREEAVRALGERAGTSGVGSAGASGAAEEAIVIAALAEDASEGVRRSAARSLRRFGNEASVKALRDALDGDAAWLVRADAATSLGRRCDRESLERLAELAHGLTAPQPEGEVDLSLASLGALVALAPPDLEARLAPLRADSIPGPLKGQIERAVAEASRHTCGAKR
ncbi:MAG TPA: HEAT repeat domain-containing protein, partial [Polyangiaceae bacterium]|nr:HEAT repeat domain-containing protein [Polyangiaceae bacterium]